jgi:hypothetical protein
MDAIYELFAWGCTALVVVCIVSAVIAIALDD